MLQWNNALIDCVDYVLFILSRLEFYLLTDSSQAMERRVPEKLAQVLQEMQRGKSVAVKKTVNLYWNFCEGVMFLSQSTLYIFIWGGYMR